MYKACIPYKPGQEVCGIGNREEIHLKCLKKIRVGKVLLHAQESVKARRVLNPDALIFKCIHEAMVDFSRQRRVGIAIPFQSHLQLPDETNLTAANNYQIRNSTSTW